MKTNKLTVFEYYNRNAMRERIKRCYKDDLQLTEEQKEFKSILAKEVNEKIATEMKSLRGDMIEKKALEDLVKKVNEIVEKAPKVSDDTEFKSLNEEINRMGLELKSIVEKPRVDTEVKSWEGELKKLYTEKKSEIDQVVQGKQEKPLRFEMKAAVTMTTLNNIDAAGSASHYTLTSNTGIISTLRKRLMKYLSSVNVGGLPIEKPYAMWVEELDEQGTPIFIGEGDTKIQLSVRYEEREKKAKKIAVFGKVTTEMIKYLPQLINYIKGNLLKRMDIKTEDQLFNGDDTGNNLKGLIPYATAFDGGIGVAGGVGLAGKVENPTNADVLRAVALQVENSYGEAGKIFITPDFAAEMDVEKATDGHYILPPFKTVDGRTVAGMTVETSTALNGTGVDFVGGDLSVVNVQFLEEAVIQVGLDGNDFTNNKKTILVEQQLVQFVSANDTQVLVKGTFEAAKAIINKQ